MAISKSHRIRRSSCKVFPGRCSTGNGLANPLALALVFVTLAAVSMLAPCSALPSESTTFPADIEEIVNQNETTVEPALQEVAIDPVETRASEVVDDLVDTSFVALAGEDLEQDIRNAVKSEMELEMEADASSPVVQLKEELAQDQENKTDHQETEVQSAREPKTLEAEEEGSKEVPLNPQANNDQTKELQQTNTNADTATATEHTPVSSEQEEGRSRPLPSVTSDLVSVIFNENRAITEQPITKTNLLALEQEHEVFEDRETTPLPIYEGPKHQVTKKQGVEDLLPVEVAPEVPSETPSQETKTVLEERILEEQTDSLNEIDSEEIEPKAISTISVEPTNAEVETKADIEAKAEIAAKAEIEAQIEEAGPPEETVVEPAEPQDPVNEASGAEIAIPETTEETATEVLSPNEEHSEEEEEVAVARTEQIKTVHESTETQKVVDSDVPKGTHNVEDESIEEKEAESDETDAKTEQSKDDDDSSGKEEKPSAADEPKCPSDDSTATPLVSYPPHDAGQTFDSNSADEHSAPLSRPSSYRSTMIIALCSGTAVIFIITSLVIFVVSFQRQHGTLDIEMQEQRLGKDSLHEEDAQMKLLDVDLSTPVIVSMGSEETEECL
ncbi:translation initiation factor IF-2 [Drosophila miranda]|uniref:translation initiation factor IF-2 n=1 Tax=Drosophila miranda TaxID=7229 RepID=UPI0007E837D7|nr:translation initiation factor IF-2 [Drosophila miranda]